MNPPGRRKLFSFKEIAATTVLVSALGLGVAEAKSADLDRDGITNSVDPDVDGDGIPNGKDRNVDGGICRRGPLKGKHVGDRLTNGSRREKDIDGDGIDDLLDDDVDGDGQANDLDDDDDGDDIPDDGDATLDDDEIGREEARDLFNTGGVRIISSVEETPVVQGGQLSGSGVITVGGSNGSFVAIESYSGYSSSSVSMVSLSDSYLAATAIRWLESLTDEEAAARLGDWIFPAEPVETGTLFDARWLDRIELQESRESRRGAVVEEVIPEP